MRSCLLLIPALVLLSGCAAPAEGEPHPFDKYMDRSSGMDIPRQDSAPACTSYGCNVR